MEDALALEPLRSLITSPTLAHALRGCLEDDDEKPQAKLP